MSQNRRAEVDAALEDVDFDSNTYQVEFETTVGTILLDVYPDVAPGHSKNLIGLTKIGYYNDIIFHRIIKDFMIQTGDPTGTGRGGASIYGYVPPPLTHQYISNLYIIYIYIYMCVCVKNTHA